MRDVIITMIVIGALPFILARPFLGVLMWTWLGLPADRETRSRLPGRGVVARLREKRHGARGGTGG